MIVPLQFVPLGRDGRVNAVQGQVFVDRGRRDLFLFDDGSKFERDEDRSDLCDEADREQDRVGGKQDSFLGSGNGESEEADGEGVEAEGDDVGRNDGEERRPEVELGDVVELHEDDGREDEDCGGDEQKDVAQVQKLLVLGHPLLDHRQRRLLRS